MVENISGCEGREIPLHLRCGGLLVLELVRRSYKRQLYWPGCLQEGRWEDIYMPMNHQMVTALGEA